MEFFISTYGLYAAYFLVGLAVVLAIILPLINSLSNPKALLGSLVGLVAILVVFFIGYSISSSDINAVYTKFGIDEGSSKFIGGALITMYLMIGIALVSILVTEVNKIFK
jgi:formate hydrogenlyase subunit 4